MNDIIGIGDIVNVYFVNNPPVTHAEILKVPDNPWGPWIVKQPGYQESLILSYERIELVKKKED